MQFLYPEFLWFGAAASVAAVGLTVWAARQRRRDLDRAVAPRLRAALAASVSPVRRAAKAGLAILALAALSVALARPIRGYEEHEVKSRGIDVMVALDTSKSMDATDIAPSRLERAKFGIARFVDGLHGDRVGLVPFAGDAFVTCPQTLDHAAFLESLQELDTDTMPLGGSDLGAAIREAEIALAESGGDQKVLLLITDGEALQGDALASAEHAAQAGITIHTVGVGTQQGELLRRADGGYVVDEAGQPVRSKLDERGLQAIAAAAGGRYEPLGRRAEGLLAIRDEVLSALPKSELGGRLRRTPIEAAELPLGLAVAALVLGFVLRESRRRVQRVARAISSAGPRLAAAAALAMLAGGIALPAQEPTAVGDPRVDYNEARQLYADGDFAAARAGFESSLTSADPGVHALAYYGIGNAQYRLGESVREGQPKSTVAHWEQSIEAYDRALGLNPEDADARFNRDFVARKLEELRQELEEQEQQSEDEQQGEDSQEQESQDEQQGEDSQEQEPQDEQQGEDSQEQESQDEQQGEDSQEQQSEDGQQGEDSQEQDSQDEQQGEDSQEQQPEDGQQGEDSQEQEPQDGQQGEGSQDQQPQDGQQDEQQGEDAQDQPSQDAQSGDDSQARRPPVGERQPVPDTSEDRGEETPRGQPEPVQPVGEAGEPDPDRQVEGAVMTVRQAEHLLESLEDQEGRLRFMPARVRDRQRNNDRRDW